MKRMIILLSLFVGACATPTPAPNTTASVATPVVAAAPTAAATVSGVDADTQAMIAKAHAMGYFPRQQNGQTVYCKRETPIGSRLPETTCMTEAALLDVIRNVATTQQNLNRPVACSGGRCTG